MKNSENGTSSPFFMEQENRARLFFLMILAGVGGFYFLLVHRSPARAWQAYLTNFLVWSAMAQGGLLFSVIMHITKARWSRGLCAISEGFAFFFPVSLIFFAGLFFGQEFVFPWIHLATGKEAWLNVPFLMTRDLAGLLILFGVGLCYVYHAMTLRFQKYSAGKYQGFSGKIRAFLENRWSKSPHDPEKILKKKTVFGILYAVCYALVLSLLGYDLVLSADPHFVSTLFGAYTFVKAFYAGLGALIILVSVLYLGSNGNLRVTENQFHDLGKLFFGFCLLWADFFYCQLVVIWYGNIPEETQYIITRTLLSPWKELAWFVFTISFILPFFVLLNKKVKTKPRWMVVLCVMVILGIWLEHLLLLGPELNPGRSLPIGLADGFIFIGFLGIMAFCLRLFLRIFPEILNRSHEEGES
ncbi:MAG: hypothetical protein KKF30_18355 [Proteobacteria bacterium]|nr:hypothetical protein [Pseudomonadota bacterium]MBU4469790.1 hypothetical protein [Pseudomonadota bacterium]MCG2753025.1 hypothetical protein [Desulfobacteraceae bacterium]